MKKPRKIISLIVCMLFAINNNVYPLGVAPGTQNSDVIEGWAKATGGKQFAKWGACPVDIETYIRPEEFIGQPKDMPAGISLVKRANYEKMFEQWEDSAFFKEILYKNDNYKKIQFGEVGEIEKLLVDAFKYYRTYEAQIPEDLVDVKIRNFPVKEEDGEVPISRIEKYKDGKYALIIHSKFARMWVDILKNDRWIKYDEFVDKNNPKKGKQTRYASLAWGIFYRIAKHEMTDLDSKTKKTKSPQSSHLTWYTGELFDGGSLVEKRSEIDANKLGGNYSEINDGMWLWFLGSYCFGDPTRYNNNIFEKRIDWIFNSPEAIEKDLNEEFPRLKRNIELRKWAKSLALNVNYSYYFKKKDEYKINANGKIPDIGIMKRKQKNNYIFHKIIAGYLVNTMKKQKTEQKSLDKVLKVIRHNLPEYIAAGFLCSIDKKRIEPVEISDIEFGLNIEYGTTGTGEGSLRKNLEEIDKDLARILMFLAVKIVNRTIGADIQDIQEDIILGARKDLERYVKEAIYYYFGEVELFYFKDAAIKAINSFVEGFSYEDKVKAVFLATGIDEHESEEERLEGIFSVMVSSNHLRELTNKRGFFTIRNLFSAEDIYLPKGYTWEDAERDLDAMVELGWFSCKKTEKEKRYLRTKQKPKKPGEIWAVESGILDKNVREIFSSEELEFLIENKINTIREIVTKKVDEVRAFRAGAVYNDVGHNTYLDSIEKKLELLGLNLEYPEDSGEQIFVLDLRIKNLHKKIKRPLRLNMIAGGIVTLRDIISKTENDLIMIKGMTRENVKDIVLILDVMGLSLKPVKVYLKKNDKRRNLGRNSEEKTLEEIISEYIVDIEKKVGPGSIKELDKKKQTDIQEAVKLADKTNIAIFLPQSVQLTDEVKDAILRSNKIRKSKGTELFVERVSNDGLLKELNGGKYKNCKKIVIADAVRSGYLRQKMLDEVTLSNFRDVRIINIMIPSDKHDKNRSVYQAQMLMIAMLARLVGEEKDLDKENDFDIKPLLMDLLDNSFLTNVDVKEFVANLAKKEDSKTSLEVIKNKLTYFLDTGRAISLIRKLEMEIRALQEFWTYA